ncbi:DUF2062 domain-containing protein [Thiocystis violascens]|uniref:DUF2062 domain-containing protein n=1 Tax=Thiocystis violascens (strain ATCC 17096 / DSM 198 / 6111) TaxID=765911 RepID=I3Y708_THIV6|nr:DUF2062 domain-containing protein [Thiocystis violascens]AFL72776.1 hypothetical protein Thivi_0723 [Thiocystis violascens DSM 198]
MKKWLKRVMPTPKAIRENRHLGCFGTLLHDPNLWHLNRHSVAGAFAIGLFVMYLPPVGQSFIAAGIAIFLRVNLPIAASLVWVTNPITIPPMFYFAYVVGCLILGHDIEGFNVHFWLDWHNWLEVIGPLALGCLICGAVCSLLGYLTIHALWRWKLARQIRARKERYRAMAASRLNTPSSNRQI